MQGKGGLLYHLFTWILLMVFLVMAIPTLSNADSYVGGLLLTTVQSGTVSGGVYIDASPPEFGPHDVVKNFALPQYTGIQWARLYVSAYCGHMQNNYSLTITTYFDGNGDGTYDRVWMENQNMGFNFYANGGNDNSGQGGGTSDPFVTINDHTNRVTSDYIAWYDVTSLIESRTLNVRVNTTGYDGRIKVITLVVAYNDGDSDQIKYWVNEGHDADTYYSDEYLGEDYIGEAVFAGVPQGVSNATLTVNHMASSDGLYTFNGHDLPRYSSSNGDSYIQGSYSGYDVWNVTGLMSGESATLTYNRSGMGGTGEYSGQFYKIALAVLTVQPMPPSADFTANVTSGTAPLTVQFTDLSRNATSWSWDFNDDNVTDSTEQNPNFTYALPGNYTVKLTVAGPGGTDDEVKGNYIRVAVPPPPVASFTANVSSGYVPLTVQFTDTSTNATAWAWDFDDDGIADSNARNPCHTYNSPGNYTVRLEASNAGGNDTATMYIMAELPPPPIANFTLSPTTGTIPLTVQFTDMSIGATSWLWSFGDGNTSTEQNPAHTYYVAGNYTVSLTVANAGGNNTTIRDNAIFAKPPAPVAKFSSNKTIGIVPLTVQFTDMSIGATSWLWSFGDGNTSTEQNPAHTYYVAGNYTVSLTVANAGGADTVTKSDFINATDRPVFYIYHASLAGAVDDKPSFEIVAEALPRGLRSYQLNLSIETDIASIEEVTYPTWATVNNTSSDGSVFTLKATGVVGVGATNVILATVKVRCERPGEALLSLSDARMTDEDYRENVPILVDGRLAVYVPLNASFTASPVQGEVPLTVNFTDASTGTPGPSAWRWDFGDGNASTQRNSTHTYFTPGNYTVCLTISNEYCNDNASLTINVTSPRPIANFTFNVSSGPAPLTVQFTDLSIGATSWLWSFGDGNTSTDQNPVHTYYTPNGVSPPYTVRLTVSNAVGNDTKEMKELISVAYPLPVADFVASPTSGVLPLTVRFTDRSVHATSRLWDFGDDNTSTDENPSHTYYVAGNYTVKLTVTGPGGTANKTMIIRAGATPNCDLAISGSVSTIGQVVFAREPNTVYVYNVKNNGPEQSPQTEIEVRASDGFVGRTTVPPLASGTTKTITINDTTVRSSAGSSITYTATLDPDNVVSETNESNNVKASSAKSVVYNGYKGKRYWEGGSDVKTVKAYDIQGGIVYSFGDSVYVSGSFGASGWNSYTVNWAASDLKIPDNATVREARLYVPYTWDDNEVAPDHVHITFNGQVVPYEHWYHDVSNFGAYSNYVYGLLTYNVTPAFKKNANNKALFTRDGSPNEKISMAGFTLAVVYEDASTTRKQIFMNEEFDLLGADPTGYGTNSSEATAYVPFSGMSIDTANVSRAYLITFVPWGNGPEGNLLFNGNIIASNVWDHGPSYGPQVAVDSRDVKQYLKSSGNEAGIQSTVGSTPCMAAVQEFLIVEYNTPGAEPDETLNETVTIGKGNAVNPGSTPSTEEGPGESSAPSAVPMATTKAQDTAKTIMLIILLMITITTASGLIIYYVISGGKVPLKVGIPIIMAITVLLSLMGGFVVGQSSNGAAAGNTTISGGIHGVPNATFSVVSAIRDIQDDNVSNTAPDYPADFQADNGLLFVHEKGDPVRLDGLSIRLESNGEEVTIDSSDTMPEGACTSKKASRYIEEMGDGDGTVSTGEWLMLYADGCLESDKGKAISWSINGKHLELYQGDTCNYTIVDDASGGVIQEGEFQFSV
ncbi:PKD repeat-containing protein [Methanocella conradii HZ254]|uniref:PKD repeat-containing protein n=1 Tax=Methanocella conradii (strain DSM 24694 / JCM 17849 / CGMCC 1.5162 / HZ254) TaxID=1041930 RepID=H8I8W8_METCZ|nr:DUF3344 domain-containing protein [Methanocella conradii]AFD00439.1 PKD repeat-containing protein [Methanocella conradii HZ254]